MDTTRILENAELDEARRTILREAVSRFNNELMDDGREEDASPRPHQASTQGSRIVRTIVGGCSSRPLPTRRTSVPQGTLSTLETTRSSSTLPSRRPGPPRHHIFRRAGRYSPHNILRPAKIALCRSCVLHYAVGHATDQRPPHDRRTDLQAPRAPTGQRPTRSGPPARVGCGGGGPTGALRGCGEVPP